MNWEGIGSQLSFHTFMLMPFPTLQMVTCFSRSLAVSKLFHAKEEFLFALASNTFSFLKYFSFRMVVTDWGFQSTHHNCLASIATLKASKSRNLISPLSLNTFKRFQFNQCILTFSTPELHQKFANLDEISFIQDASRASGRPGFF